MTKGKIWFVFAMQREADKLNIKETDDVKKFVVGISCTDALPETSDDDIIINIGYAGSNNLAVGSIVEPSKVIKLDTGECEKVDNVFDCPTYPCYTSNDFVTETDIVESCIFEMELFMLTKLKCKSLHAIKIVSDNLNLHDCEAYNDDIAWAKVKDIVNSKFECIL